MLNSDLKNKIQRDASPSYLSLERLAHQRPETAKAPQIWNEVLAPALSEQEGARSRLVRAALTKSAVSIVAVASLIGALVFSMGADFAVFIFGTVFGSVAVTFWFAGADWAKVITLKKHVKETILGAATACFGFSYDSLMTDLSDVTDRRSLIAWMKAATIEANASNKTKSAPKDIKDNKNRKLKTPFGEIELGEFVTGDEPPTDAYRYLCEAKLLPGHSERSFEDLVSGERAGVRFSLVEAKLEESDGDNGTDTVFQGILLNIEYPKRFLGKTVIQRSGGMNFLSRIEGLKKVDLIATELNKSFRVLSNDQVEARALLTPDRMERLIELERYFDGGKLRAVFGDGHLTMALEAEDQFEGGSIFEPLVDEWRFASALVELGLVCDLIDGFMTREWINQRRA